MTSEGDSRGEAALRHPMTLNHRCHIAPLRDRGRLQRRSISRIHRALRAADDHGRRVDRARPSRSPGTYRWTRPRRWRRDTAREKRARRLFPVRSLREALTCRNVMDIRETKTRDSRLAYTIPFLRKENIENIIVRLFFRIFLLFLEQPLTIISVRPLPPPILKYELMILIPDLYMVKTLLFYA